VKLVKHFVKLEVSNFNDFQLGGVKLVKLYVKRNNLLHKLPPLGGCEVKLGQWKEARLWRFVWPTAGRKRPHPWGGFVLTIPSSVGAHPLIVPGCF
jgi:hypothetical protein